MFYVGPDLHTKGHAPYMLRIEKHVFVLHNFIQGPVLLATSASNAQTTNLYSWGSKPTEYCKVDDIWIFTIFVFERNF